MMGLGGVIVFGFILIVMLPFTPLLFTILIAVEGVALGGVHNMYEGNEPLRLNQGRPNDLAMFINLISGIANCFFGVVSVFMGTFFEHEDDADDSQENYQIIFEVLLGIAFLSLGLLIGNSYFSKEEGQRESN